MYKEYTKNGIKYIIKEFNGIKGWSAIGVNHNFNKFQLADDELGNLKIGTINLKLIEINEAAFNDVKVECKQLVIPHSIRFIRSNAFACCDNIRSKLVIPSNVELIGDGAFFNCYNLEGELIFPDSLLSIGKYCFYECFKLTSITFSKHIKTIPQSCFERCNGLKGSLVFNENIELIEDNAFADCTNIEAVVLANKKIKVADYAFCNSKLSKEDIKRIESECKNVSKKAFSS